MSATHERGVISEMRRMAKDVGIAAARKYVRLGKRLVRCAQGRDLLLFRDVHATRQWLGNDGARYCICPDVIDAHNVVYSVGLGLDVSFDLELIRRHGVCVHGFDPNPQTSEWLETVQLPKKFVFHPLGMSDKDGVVTFHSVPGQSPTVMCRTGAEASFEGMPVRRLATILKELGHTQVDLLKMDIEGAEYGVLEDMICAKILPRQLLVEFHHRWREIGARRTKDSIAMLRDVGYRIFDVAAAGDEYSFLLQ